MSRIGSGDMIVVKPANNVYTVLALVGTLASILAIVVVFMRAKTLFPDGGLFP